MPLMFRFTRPPKMFDTEQIRLRKQIEDEMECLESAELCSECNGLGVVIEKVPDYKHSTDWNQEIDPRVYTNNQCNECLGNGIVLTS